MKGTLLELIRTIQSDLYRYAGSIKFSRFLYHYFFEPGFKVTTQFRFCRYLKLRKKTVLYPLYIFVLMIYKRSCVRYGIELKFLTDIGKGFYIGHFGTIFVSENAVIGDNVNISQGVTIGRANRGKNKGFPTVGSRVYIGPGAKIIGKVTIGNNVTIGANCVVTRDIPDNSVVVGIPCRIISQKGSLGYINHTDYDFIWNKEGQNASENQRGPKKAIL
jgi:serine O-acetyltransferase